MENNSNNVPLHETSLEHSNNVPSEETVVNISNLFQRLHSNTSSTQHNSNNNNNNSSAQRTQKPISSTTQDDISLSENDSLQRRQSANFSIGSQISNESTITAQSSLYHMNHEVNNVGIVHSASQTSLKNMAKVNSKEFIWINVSGQRFFIRTSRLMSSCRISDAFYRTALWYEEINEYYLERDPILFSMIYQYLLYGRLHVPMYICSQLVLDELQFWGFDVDNLDRKCCHVAFKTGLNDENSLNELETWLHTESNGFLTNPLNNVPCLSQVWQHAWQFLSDPRSSIGASFYFALSLLLTILSIVLYCTTNTLKPHVHGDFRGVNGSYFSMRLSQTPAHIVLETCTWFFVFECLLRLLFCPALYPYFLNLVTVMDILLLIVIQLQRVPKIYRSPQGITAIEVLHLCYILRIFRFSQLFPESRIIFYTVGNNFRKVVVIFFYLAIAAILFGAIVFITDHDDIISLDNGIWWSVITMTTVGYGDVVPKTVVGKMIGAFCAFCGISMVAVVIPIFSNTFFRNYNNARLLKEIRTLKQNRRNRCNTICEVQKRKHCHSISSMEYCEDSYSTRVQYDQQTNWGFDTMKGTDSVNSLNHISLKQIKRGV